MSIIVAQTSDIRSIAEIISESNKSVAQQFGINAQNNPKHPSFYTCEWVESDFERGEKYFVYQLKGVAVGCVAFEHPRPSTAYLNRLSVLPDYQRNGIGAALVKHVLQYSQRKQVERVSIGIISDHEILKQWYLRLGFVEVSTKRFEHLPFDVTYLNYLFQ